VGMGYTDSCSQTQLRVGEASLRNANQEPEIAENDGEITKIDRESTDHSLYYQQCG
jgi:hypothetical protein